MRGRRGSRRGASTSAIAFACRKASRRRPGWRATYRPPRTPAVKRSSGPRVAVLVGLRRRERGGHAARRGRRLVSSSRWVTSTAPTPSTSAWWVLVAIAQRPPSRPGDEAARPRAAGGGRAARTSMPGPVEQLRRGRRARAARPAGRGRRCRSPGSTTQAGQRQPAGVRLRQPAAVAGQRAEPAARAGVAGAASFGGRPRARLEHHQRADVHVRGVVGLLELEEGRVERCQPVAGHGVSSARRSVAGERLVRLAGRGPGDDQHRASAPRTSWLETEPSSTRRAGP